ncbi:MAG TPA: fused MFS/spermidine synthase [Solirubrobacteraceae bacterium]|nr:fused MFS/spermidine synthase [Solirubrobacteraceae bacterium]
MTEPAAARVAASGPRPTPWQEKNLAGIRLALRPGRAAPQGLIERRSRSGYELLTIKEGSQIQLYFAATDAPELSGIMSRVDLNRPLHLLGIYTRAMLAAMMWKPEARRVCHIGFGGGRIPMVLHHYFPELVIESTEIDAEVVRLARRWFGIRPDERMPVYTEEGRSFLARQPDTVMYDVILVDCFTGSGQHPYSLSTREFYALARSRLAPGGILATNLDASDPLFEQKVATIEASFAHVWRYQTEGATVCFGSDEPIGLDALKKHAELVSRRAPFSFPFVELLDEMHECSPAEAPEVLTDGERVSAAADDLMFQNVARNNPCPCGSGKKFKHCHGR